MSVRARFTVTAVTHYPSGSVKVEMRPVMSGSQENLVFWTATPSGVIELSITNAQAANQFSAGQEVYVDFTPVEPVEPSKVHISE